MDDGNLTAELPS